MTAIAGPSGPGAPPDPTAPRAAPPPDKLRRELPKWLPGLLGTLAILVAWQVLAVTWAGENHVVPAPTAILQKMGTDGWKFYWPNMSTTLREAAQGYLWGNVLAIVVAIVFVQVPVIERGLLRLGVASYCLPIIAIGPVLTVLYRGDTPKIILAALSVFFTTLISMLVGLRAADAASLDLVHAYGGGSWTQLRKVRLPSSIPSLFIGLRIAAPAALLGALIGEYLGGERGLGVAMIASQSGLQIERTWGIAIVASALAGGAYALTALIERMVAPWARRTKQ